MKVSEELNQIEATRDDVLIGNLKARKPPGLDGRDSASVLKALQGNLSLEFVSKDWKVDNVTPMFGGGIRIGSGEGSQESLGQLA